MVIVHINFHTLNVFALQYDSMSGLVLPGKRTFNNMNKDFLEKRKVGLNAFLQVNIYVCYHKKKIGARMTCMHAEYVCNHAGPHSCTQGLFMYTSWLFHSFRFLCIAFSDITGDEYTFTNSRTFRISI